MLGEWCLTPVSQRPTQKDPKLSVRIAGGQMPKVLSATVAETIEHHQYDYDRRRILQSQSHDAKSRSTHDHHMPRLDARQQVVDQGSTSCHGNE
jgi:hypothetical protein